MTKGTGVRSLTDVQAEARRERKSEDKKITREKKIRAQRTTWQMSLTVDEKEWIDSRSRELGLTMAGYVKRLVADDRRKVERERRRSK